MRPRHHLVLALNAWGHGETTLGLRLAVSLRAGGESAVFLSTRANAPLVQRAGFRSITLAREAHQLLPLYIADFQSKLGLQSLILSDHFTTGSFLRRTGLSLSVLSGFQVPVIGIDTWDSSRSEGMDVQDHGQTSPVDVVTQTVIRPVPFLSPGSAGAYQSLPEVPRVASKVKKNVRRSLGMSDACRAVLFCTAAWQQGEHPLHGRWLMAESVPLLLAEYLSRLGESVHVVHVGPKVLPMGDTLGSRYHWLPQLPSQDFQSLLGSVDLLLSVNISAATIAEAMIAGVPVVVVQNSTSIARPEDRDAALAGRTLSPAVRRWIDESLPICTFALWPVGFYRFVAPVLTNNPYTQALEVLDLLDEETIEQRLRQLLTDRATRDEHLHRQQAYVEQVRRLHDGCHAVRALCA